MHLSSFRYLIRTAIFLAFTNVNMSSASEGQAGQLLLFADIHLDPIERSIRAADLSSVPPDQWEAIYAEKATPVMPNYGSDSNFSLMRSSLLAVADQALDSDFIIYGGDFLTHKFNEKASRFLRAEPDSKQVRQFAIDTTLFVSYQIRAAIPTKPIVVLLGNTDSACGDYEIEPSGAYLAGIATRVKSMIGSELVHPDFDSTFGAGGYYALRHPTAKLTDIVVLNNLFWSEKYQNACGTGSTNIGETMLRWLDEKLSNAQAQGRKVWLLYHVPLGIDAFSTNHASGATCQAKIVPFWHERFTRRFLHLRKEYADTISIALSAHIHHDSFRLLGDAANQAYGYDKIVPAISPIYGNNPGFHVMSFDRNSSEISDYRTYYLSNLTEVSAETSAKWKTEYHFNKAYDFGQFGAEELLEIWKSFGTADTRNENQFRTFNPVSHGALETDKMPAYRCAIKNLTVQSFGDCWCKF